MFDVETLELHFRKLSNITVNGKVVYVDVFDDNGLVEVCVVIWGPAYDCYFRVGKLRYCGLDVMEEYLEKDIVEECRGEFVA